MSERDSSQTLSLEDEAAEISSRRDASYFRGERVLRHLRTAQVLAHGDAVAWVHVAPNEERVVLSLGIDPYLRDLALGPLVQSDVERLNESAERARLRWPSHPIVLKLREQGSLVVHIVGNSRSSRFALVVASRQPVLSEPEQSALGDIAWLLATELGSARPLGAILKDTPPYLSLDVQGLSHILDERQWLNQQIVQLLPTRLLFIFDHERLLRLVLGDIDSYGETGTQKRTYQTLDDVPLLAKRKGILSVCLRALQGEDHSLMWKGLGRHFGIRTAPLRARDGTVLFGICMIHEITGDAANYGLEQLLSTRLRTLIDSLDSAVLVEDENDIIQHCNQHFCALMQLEDGPECLIGKPSPELIARISPVFFIPEALAEGIDELKAAKKVVKDELVYLADMRILERSYSPLEFDGQCVGHLWTYRDVSDRERNKDLLQRQADELRALSLVDELTGLYNRRGFLTLATQQLKLCDRSMRAALIVFVDLDGMKRINDELGHEYGDIALVETASVLRQSFRYSDVIARLGGDEFVVLAFEADPPLSSVVSERISEKLAEMNAKPERKFELKFSVGIAAYDPSKSEMVEEVLARADGLMYEQKRLHKNARRD